MIDYGDRKLADEQMRKAAGFFGRVLEHHRMGKMAARVGDVAILVVRGEESIERLEEILTGQFRAVDAASPFLPEGFSFGGELPDDKESRESRESTESTGSTESPETDESLEPGDPGRILHTGDRDRMLEPRFHAPPPEHAHKGGNVHLHVLSDVRLGRRSRKAGECLCSKKHGTFERPPEGETKMCDECVRVAADNELAWTL